MQIVILVLEVRQFKSQLADCLLFLGLARLARSECIALSVGRVRVRGRGRLRVLPEFLHFPVEFLYQGLGQC